MAAESWEYAFYYLQDDEEKVQNIIENAAEAVPGISICTEDTFHVEGRGKFERLIEVSSVVIFYASNKMVNNVIPTMNFTWGVHAKRNNIVILKPPGYEEYSENLVAHMTASPSFTEDELIRWFKLRSG